MVALVHPCELALARKVRYAIDPDNPYPREYTGHVRATLANGDVVEERQPYIRGGAHAPLSGAELARKFAGNVRHGGWSAARGEAFAAALPALLDAPTIDLVGLRA